MSNSAKRIYIYLPIYLSIAFIIGMFTASKLDFTSRDGGKLFSLGLNNRINKLNEALNYISEEYVDSLDKSAITGETIRNLLSNLDPFSSYIEADRLSAVNEPLHGNFSGIGIEFNIVQDTIVIISTVSGGPSENLGLQAGDRIIKIEDQQVAGTGITTRDVIASLRGEIGSNVTVSIMRSGTTSMIDYIITRGDIPIRSIDLALMASDSVGYIKIGRFSSTTFEEYLDAFHTLSNNGMSAMIIDLRGNPGGYLSSATLLADEFLGKGKLIVYTKGKARPKATYYATGKGGFEKGRVVVLIDEASASASEILAGAIQDNDRGIIIGRRSFGKGLVQEQFEFPDGSAIRLTVARYYTPTGRCIQKPYSKGIEEYYKKMQTEFDNEIMAKQDSLYFSDSLMFITQGGKKVYGSGGIYPDILIEHDTAVQTALITSINVSGVINKYAFECADKNRKKFTKFDGFDEFSKKFFITDDMFNDFMELAKNAGINASKEETKQAQNLIKVQLKANIARYIYKDKGYFTIMLTIDNAFIKAMETLNN